AQFEWRDGVEREPDGGHRRRVTKRCRRRGGRQDDVPAPAADHEEGKVSGQADGDPSRVGAPDRSDDLVRVDRAQQSKENQHTDRQQHGRLDQAPAAYQPRPASRSTVSMARMISWREIFDWPARRSVKVMGTSTILRPARSQRVSSSTRAEYPDDRNGWVTRNCRARCM